ncbi:MULTISPECIES: hypothetical protein [Rhizobium]|uniref:Uncharacterized protein n=1 Tax=Rhizobium rhododendri TaxID=2506430 RepID=A0ABY8IMH6_9HYPH|nr:MULTISPECIES: hypothetical protein [Rhizobium]TQX83471.1 hypothetical protein EQW76_26855 [Rhizobium sp. rho-13.1]TQY06542.1 hypothetical protein EQW74_26215 [Rhizobium sp. rho-1.1]WFS24899.1 hypothetical protein PR018_21610 [Rhizobium rhododendri]
MHRSDPFEGLGTRPGDEGPELDDSPNDASFIDNLKLLTANRFSRRATIRNDLLYGSLRVVDSRFKILNYTSFQILEED